MARAEAGAIAVAGTPISRSRPRIGSAVFGLTTVACFLALALDVHTGRLSRALTFIVVAEVLGLLGALLTARMPRHTISWVIALGGLWWGVSLLISAYAVEALVTDAGSLPGGMAAAVFDSWAWLPGLALFLSLLLVLMPDGGLGSSRGWPVPASVAAGTAMFAFVSSTDPTFAIGGVDISNPLALRGPVVDGLAIAGVLLVIAGLVASLVAFAVRYRRSNGVEQQQLRWVG